MKHRPLTLAALLALLAAFALLLAFLGGSARDAGPKAPAVPAAEITAAPAEEATAAPTEDAPTEEPTAAPTEEPTAAPTEEPEPEPAALSLGGETTVPADRETLSLKASDFAYEALLTALPQMEKLKSLTLEQTDLTRGQIDALRAAAPETEISYTVQIGKMTVPSDAQERDLSAVKPKALPELVEKLALLDHVETVELMDAKGKSALAPVDVKAVMDAMPEAQVHYEFELFGRQVSTLDEELLFDPVTLEDEDEQELREALDILQGCRRIVLDKTFRGMKAEILGQIRDDYPERGVVWRVYFPGYAVQTSASVSMLTDEEILRITFMLNDYNSIPLKYCNNAVYVDVGHNDQLSDISFVGNMPRLECFIASGSIVRDISRLAECPNLTWAEFCFCTYLEDISPLEELENLKYLNVSYTGVTDISPLEDVPLERLVTFHCMVPPAQQAHFIEKHPDCLAGFEGEQPYGYPWRYNDGGQGANNFFEYYIRMRELFIYDDRNYVNNTKGNRYGPGYIELRPYNLVYDENGRLRTTTPWQELQAQKAAEAAASAGPA